MIKKSNVLIIGGCGFIGFHLAKKLSDKARNNTITIIDNLSRGVFDQSFRNLLNERKIKFIKLDFTKNINLELIRNNFNYIFQFAAILGVDNVIMNPSNVLYNNVMIHFNSWKLAKRQKKLKKFVFSSTSEVYLGSSLSNKLKYPTKESHEIILPNLNNPRSSYMMSKIFCETLNNLSEIPYLNIRPHNIFGPRMGFSHAIPEILLNSIRTKKNGKFFLKNPNHKRSFCFIDDSINQIEFVSSSNKYYRQTVNIGSDKNEISMIKLTKKIHNVLNRKDIKIISSKKSHNSSPERRLPSMIKIKKNLTNYSPTELMKGIELTYEWYKFSKK